MNIEGEGMTAVRVREELWRDLERRGIRSEVLEAMRAVPRHLFMDQGLSHYAYKDNALPIACEQTISQPYIVARMSELALGEPGEPRPSRVLEIGTGSGYQTAVLANLVDEVYTVERIETLHKSARKLLRQLGLRNVRYRLGDGNLGWPEQAPFEAIVVTAAAALRPERLLEQLDEGARLVAPIGVGTQRLHCYRRLDGEIVAQKLDDVRFVAMMPGVERG